MSVISALDLCPVEKVVRIGKEDYALQFNHRMLREAELVYIKEYERVVNAGIILGELLAGTLTALMAVAYGAIRAGGRRISWDTFDNEIFGVDAFDPLFDAVSDAIVEMFGTSRDDAAAEATGDTKN